MRRALAAVLVLAAAGATAPAPAWAHAGLTNSDPPAGATLGASPTSINLTFSERPDAALSTIAVSRSGGRPRAPAVALAATRPTQAAGDPLTLSIPISPLPKGVYTVHWRVDSAIDGHATTGSFSFGVQVAPPQVSAAPRTNVTPVSSTLEVIARWVLLVGLVLLVGVGAAALGAFNGGGRCDLLLGAGAWLCSVVGLLLLAKAQQRNAGSSLSALLGSPVGHALIGRAVAIATAGVALLAARRARLRGRNAIARGALTAAGVAAVAAIIVHVANGHAAASAWASLVTVIAQSVHVIAAGVWIGGLAALLVALRTLRGEARSGAIKRFALAAAAGLVAVTLTGIVRAVSELDHLDQLWATGYGRAVLAKLALVALIAWLATVNRRRGAVSAVELPVAAVAIAVAALLGTLAPPVASRAATFPGLSASGTDVGGNVHVSLHAASNQPGPNQFSLKLTNARSDDAISDAAVQLVFEPLDDPGVSSSSLTLPPSPDQAQYAAAGANLRFDGRWGVRVLVRRGGGTVEVPLELDPVGPPQRVTIEHIAGRPVTYTTLVGNVGFVRISPNPERPGPSRLTVTCYDAALGGEMPVRTLVLTLAAGGGPVRQQAVQRAGPGTFFSDVRLVRGTNRIGIVAHTDTGDRMRSVFDLRLPGG